MNSQHNLYFSLLPFDLLSPLLLYFDSPELLYILSNLDDFNSLLEYYFFWNKIWRRDISSFIPLPADPYETYRLIFDSLPKMSSSEKISYLAENGYDILLMPLLSDFVDYNRAMAFAARGCHMQIVELMIEKGATAYNWAMAAASESGCLSIIDLMRSLGATAYNTAMAAAAGGGQADIVNLMLGYGANDYDWAIGTATAHGNRNIVRLLQSHQLEIQ